MMQSLTRGTHAFPLLVNLVVTAAHLLLSPHNGWGGVNHQAPLGGQTMAGERAAITSLGKCTGWGGLGQLKLISWSWDSRSTSIRGGGAETLALASKS